LLCFSVVGGRVKIHVAGGRLNIVIKIIEKCNIGTLLVCIKPAAVLFDLFFKRLYVIY